MLIATAFVHLLPTAFVSLTDPCLPAFWNKGYPAMPGFIAMASVLVVVGIEMFFATRGAGHVHGGEYDGLADERGRHGYQHPSHRASSPRVRQNALRRFSQGPIGEEIMANGSTLNAISGRTEHRVWGKEPSSPNLLASPLPPDVDTASPLPESDNESDLDLNELDPTTASGSAELLKPTHYRHNRNPDHNHSSTSLPPPSPSSLSPQALERKLLLQCLLLEAGILFHSIFIGIALSVSTGPPFAVLLVAISFHQTFEGLALGSRIAAIPTLAPTSPKPWLMALAYGATTPLGQAVGLGVHGLYDPQGQMGLLMVGSMNAISSGLLLFAGLVELLAEDFLSDASYVALKGRRRIEACAAVVAGAFLMAFVGAFA